MLSVSNVNNQSYSVILLMHGRPLIFMHVGPMYSLYTKNSKLTLYFDRQMINDFTFTHAGLKFVNKADKKINRLRQITTPPRS